MFLKAGLHSYSSLAVLLFLATILSGGCSPSLGAGIRPPEILFPTDGASFSESSAVNLVASEDGTWLSDISGELGTGKSIEISLLPGMHRIVFTSHTGLTATMRLVVTKDSLKAGETAFIMATRRGTSRTLGLGLFSAFLYSTAEESIDVEYTITPAQADSRRNLAMMDDAGLPPRNSLSLLPSTLLETVRISSDGAKRFGLDVRTTESPAKEGDKRNWRMADPAIGTGAPGFSIQATLIAIVGDCELWLDDDSTADAALLDSFIDCCTVVAIPRVRALWGSHHDRNGDGRLAFLISGKLNESGLAIGFFNPCDFFPANDDPLSNEYNPTSNESDVIYIGLPADESANPAFSPKAIAATVAHEYQHLARFGKKTYLPAVAGSAVLSQEDTAFDEGMSHLTESLVGLGCSGGNALFALRYLQSPGLYSLRGLDADGKLDSAGKRGGDALFLAWLLDRSGGLSWSAENPTSLDIEGSTGLAFLQASMSSSDEGWELTEIFFKRDLQLLFRDYVVEINRIVSGLDTPIAPTIDVLTSEPITLSPWMGRFFFGDIEHELSGPTLRSWGKVSLLPSWSVEFLETVDAHVESRIFVKAVASVEGSLFLGATRCR